MTTDVVLDALEQALCARQPDSEGELIHPFRPGFAKLKHPLQRTFGRSGG